MTAATLTKSSGQLLHRPCSGGDTFWGPGDVYRFLVTGEETGGAYFAMEALVPPGGGPPLHIHRNEDETFYVLEGRCDFRLDDDVITAGAGDFVNIPRGAVHRFHNAGDAPARLILTFTRPASRSSSRRPSNGRWTPASPCRTTSTRWPRATSPPLRATASSSSTSGPSRKF